MRVRRTMAVADKVARRVGALLRGIRRDHYSQDIYLYPYLNGRERGYALQADLDIPTFLFAESRGSDDIVVYEDLKWSVFGTGIPSEESYKNSKHFGCEKEEQAARYIVTRLKKLIRERDRDKKAKRKAEKQAHESMLKRHAARKKKAAKRRKVSA